MLRQLLFIVVIAGFMHGNVSAQVTDESLQKITTANTEKLVKAIEKVGASIKDTTVQKPLPPPLLPLDKAMTNLLTLFPVIFYLVVLLIVWQKLKREGVRLSWFLLDKELIAQLGKQDAQVETARLQAIAKAPTPEIAALAARAGGPVPGAQMADEPAPPEETDKESVSRLIALLTGLITLGIASCITSFYIYKSFTGHADIDLGKLATVLYGLGLGLVPYGFTKVAGALKG